MFSIFPSSRNAAPILCLQVLQLQWVRLTPPERAAYTDVLMQMQDLHNESPGKNPLDLKKLPQR
jgi:hypothetical protein